MYLNMFGTDVMVLNSSETIADLLDKRSAIYSDKVTTTYHACLARADPAVCPPHNSLKHR